MGRGWLVDDEPDVPEPKDADKRLDHAPSKAHMTWFCYEVTLHGIVAHVRPSGMCALLIPHADSEKELTVQQSLDQMPRHQLALFAAVQAVEWNTDLSEPGETRCEAMFWEQIYLKCSCRQKAIEGEAMDDKTKLEDDRVVVQFVGSVVKDDGHVEALRNDTFTVLPSQIFARVARFAMPRLSDGIRRVDVQVRVKDDGDKFQTVQHWSWSMTKDEHGHSWFKCEGRLPYLVL